MKKSRNILNRLLVVSVTLALVVLSAVWMKPKSESFVEPHAHAHSATSAQGQNEREPRQLVRVFIHNDDIYPSVVRARPGKILLKAENQTLGDVALIVERKQPGQAPAREARLATQNQARRHQQDLTLGVGEYEFYTEARPEIRGLLIVEARQ